MPLRVAILSAAHVHAPSFAACFAADPRAEIACLWDNDHERGKAFASERGIPFQPNLTEALEGADAAAICSENMRHLELLQACADRGIPVLCEKPIAPTREHHAAISALDLHGSSMTAFPCPFAPAFEHLKQRVESGAVGEVIGITATNRGRNPGGWFTDPDLSGGGAMIDHVVHVSDLLRRLLGAEPAKVHAQIGSNHEGRESDDTAMLTLDYPGGIFATLDSSWSRPASYKTWGDVTLRVTGTEGVIEADLFAPGVDLTSSQGTVHAPVGANLDALMVGEFLAAVTEGREPVSTIADGLAASLVAIRGYESVNP